MTYEIVVLGASWGGLRATQIVVAAFPRDWTLPLVIVQQREQTADQTLAELLRQRSVLPLIEVEDRQRILAGHVFLAPAGCHLLVERGRFALSREEPVTFARPSIDVLFESAADAYARGVGGVLLTGANADGATGLAAIKQRGGLIVVQDVATAKARHARGRNRGHDG
jgi:two-component system chemotaxis response regulator CheB